MISFISNFRAKYDFDYEEFDTVSPDAKVTKSKTHCQNDHSYFRISSPAS